MPSLFALWLIIPARMFLQLLQILVRKTHVFRDMKKTLLSNIITVEPCNDRTTSFAMCHHHESGSFLSLLLYTIKFPYLHFSWSHHSRNFLPLWHSEPSFFLIWIHPHGKYFCCPLQRKTLACQTEIDTHGEFLAKSKCFRSCFLEKIFSLTEGLIFNDDPNIELIQCKNIVILKTLSETSHQARNQLGTPGGRRVFLRGAQIFWSMSYSFKLCPPHFSRGEKSSCDPLFMGLPHTLVCLMVNVCLDFN